jgi:hypothetical protein
MMPGAEAPLTWEAETDPVSGKPIGLLGRCIATKSCPCIIQTFTSTEYRQYPIAKIMGPVTEPSLHEGRSKGFDALATVCHKRVVANTKRPLAGIVTPADCEKP